MVPRQSSTHRTQALATFFVIFSVVAAQSQQETSHQQHTGSVIGQVICDDTRAPARFAEVRLILKPSEASLANTDDQPPPEPAKPQLRRAAGVTEIDGAFRIDNVPAGDYFAAAIEPGYLTP